ncbi:MAG: hypothetical protein WCN87_04605 [Chlamydiota bacterium]
MFKLFFSLILLFLTPLAADTAPLQDKAAELYSSALRAMSCKDYTRAKKVFLELLENHKAPTNIVEEVELQIIEAEIGLCNYQIARIRIKALLNRPNLPFLHFRSKMLLAQLEFDERHIQEAARLLKEQETICPLKDWPLQYKVLYATIELLKE